MIDVDLARMARDGLIVKELVQISAPARPVYRLSALGQEFAALASPLMAWIDAHQAEIEATRQSARVLKEAGRTTALVADRTAAV
jgi:DNA-binding HxlR family transcriptional regulator